MKRGMDPMSVALHGARSSCVTMSKSQDREVVKITGHASVSSYQLYDKSIVVDGALSRGWVCDETSQVWM